jgi:hypothetical protein
MNDRNPSSSKKRGPVPVKTARAEFRAGDRVRLRPRGGADILDLVLAGKTATIVAIERDREDRVHLAVTVDDDPGRDLGAAGKPAHRFFFSPEEVEPLGASGGSGA